MVYFCYSSSLKVCVINIFLFWIAIWPLCIRPKRPQVKTAPSQNIPKLVKTSPTAVADWSKRPQKPAPKMAPNSTGFK